MKKTAAFLLTVMIILSLASCGSGGKGSSSVTQKPTESTTEETEVKANIVTDSGAAKELLEELEAQNFGGVLYAEKNGKPFASYTNGTLTGDVPITLDTPLPIASVSKQFCAAAIMLLEERGKLSVDDKLSDYFPECGYGDKITLHNMLCMRSGIPNFNSKISEDTVSIDNTDEENTKIVLDWVFNEDLDYEPDEMYEYSNLNYILLGNIIEKVTGEKYIDFLRKNIFEPLEMNHSGSVTELKDNPDWAKSFSYKNEDIGLGIEPGVSKGAGDLISNAEDMTKWMNALPSGKIISKESFKKMITNYSSSSEHYGYALSTNMKGSAGHFGSIGKFNSCDYFSTSENFTLFIVTNTAGGNTLKSKCYSLVPDLIRAADEKS